MRGATPVMTYPSPDHEQPYPRHATHLPTRDAGRAEPVPPPWLPPPTAYLPAESPGPSPVSGRPPGWAEAAPSSAGYGQAPHPTPAGGYLPERSAWEFALPDLRNKVVNRLADANWNQAMTAWQVRRNDPLNPHALFFFFAEPPTGTPPRCALRVAARLFPHGDEPRLAMLLHDLVPVVGDHIQARRDLNVVVFNWHEDRSPDAAFLGLGVSSLDTPAGSWAQVQKTAQSDMDVPGRCYAHLADGSMLLIDRLARQHFGEVRVWASDAVWDVSGQRQRRATTARDLATSDVHGPDNPAIWRWLAALHHAITGGPTS